ncbi:MAG: hypothetical protein ACK5JH_05765 [Anaerocolumna sp.]
MSNSFNNDKMIDLIQTAMQERVQRTTAFMDSTEDKEKGADTVSIMLNGVTKTVSKEDYKLLKTENTKTKQQMKDAIKALTAEFKTDLKVKKPEVSKPEVPYTEKTASIEETIILPEN